MNKVTKVLVTVGMLIVCIFILSILNIRYTSGSQIRTILGVIVIYFVTRMIWKLPSKNNNNGNQTLGKTK